MAEHVKITRSASDISPKTAAATVGAAVAVIGVWLIETATGIDIPEGVEIAGTVLLTFIGGYFIKDNVVIDK